MKLIVKLILLFFLCWPQIAFAELPAQVNADFAVVNGLIVMPLGEEYVVDLDASSQLRVGDILTMVTPSKKIIHPETKEVIGSVNIAVGYLQVTRVLSGYSYAKTLYTEVEPKAGDPVHRFEQVPAFFVDKSESDGSLVSQLKMDLPQFKWLHQGNSDQALLTFVLQPGSLEVKTSDGLLLHSYTITEEQQLAAPSTAQAKPFVAGSKPEPKFLQQVTNNVLKTLKLDSDDPFSESNVGIIKRSSAAQQGVWIGPNLDGHPVGIAVAELDGDGLQETAVVLGHRLLISQIKGDAFTEKAEVSIPIRLEVLSMDSIDLDNDGISELCLTALDGYTLSSLVVKYTGESYEIVIERVRWFLRVVELLGKEKVLVGQNMGNQDEVFEGRPFIVQLKDGHLVRGEDVVLPQWVNIYSFVPFTDASNSLYYAYLSKGDYLKVVSEEGVVVWESSDYFGGTENCFYNRQEYKDEMLAPSCIGSRLITGPDNEILAGQNVGIRFMSRYRKYKESRLISMSWNGSSMLENWRTAGQQGYMGDFTMADANNDGLREVVMAVKFKHKGLTSPPRSAIVTYALD